MGRYERVFSDLGVLLLLEFVGCLSKRDGMEMGKKSLGLQSRESCKVKASGCLGYTFQFGSYITLDSWCLSRTSSCRAFCALSFTLVQSK